MKYDNIVRGVFLERPNRFIARVETANGEEIVHVKNTGRCRELLIPGAEVFLTAPGNPLRKTRFDLVAVRKSSGLLVNIDSQAPNRVAGEWLETRGYDSVAPEFRYGESRLDFCMRRGEEMWLMEVKGCTLEVEGVGWFPDAPTQRGAKHLMTLAQAAEAGLHAQLAFVIQMDGVREVRPNEATDPAFAQALATAGAAGVEVLFLSTHVMPGGMEVVDCRRMERRQS